jgi:hypothetical protein
VAVERRPTVIDEDVQRAIEDLKADRDRLQRQLEFIARYADVREGYRAAFYSLRWYARTALYGEVSPGTRWKARHADSAT